MNPEEYYNKIIESEQQEEPESIIGKDSDFWLDKHQLATNTTI